MLLERINRLISFFTGKNNSYLVKRNGVQLSRDPLNLTNRHSRKWAGFVNEQVRFQKSTWSAKQRPPIHSEPNP